MLNHSEQIDQIASALADAQADLGVVVKQSQNEAFGSKYADLSRVWEAFQRVGPRHGLSVVQLPGRFNSVDRTMSMSVKLMHNSGQWIGGDMSMPLSRADAHAYGSACTYARRYSLAALVGICPHDDDGNEACSVHPAAASVPGYWRRSAPVPSSRTAATPAARAGSPSGAGEAAPRLGSQAAGGSGSAAVAARVSASGDGAAVRAAATLAIPQDPQSLEELGELIRRAGVEEAALCQHYRVEAIAGLSPRDAARARRALLRKIQSAEREVC